MATPNRNKNEDGPKGSPKRGQGDGQEQNQPKTEEERIPNNRQVNDSLQRGPPATGVNIKQQDYLLILVMLIASSAIQNEEWLQRLQQENRNHEQRVRKENRKQLRRLTQENRNHQQRVQKENQEHRNHQQRVQKENQEQLQRLTQESRNHQQRVQEENQEQLQRLKQENRNHLQRVQEENQEQLQRVKQENQNHHLQIQNQLNQMHQENREHLEQQLRQLRQDLQLKQKENLDGGGRTDNSDEGEGDICCMCRKCKCHCHIHDKSTHGNVKDKHKLAGTMRRDTGHHRTVPRDKESDLDVPKNFKNNHNYTSDSDHERPKSGHRNGNDRKISSLKEKETEDGVHQIHGASGGDPPSSDPSSDDDSDGERRDKKNKKEKSQDNNTGKKAKRWIIDADAWTSCLKSEQESRFENQASSLLEEGKLPDQILLNEICSKHTRQLPHFQNICDGICNYIKQKSNKIVQVWPAYQYKNDDRIYGKEITFVVLTTAPDDVNLNEFAICKRCIFDVASKKENMKINKKESNDRPSSKEIEDLEKCLKENARKLMKCHSKLTRVTASWFKSRGHDTDEFSLRKEHCIALYVHVKGFIPLNEEPFPKQVGNYPVDVREGIFTLCRGPHDYHENVKMGCSIKGEEKHGTLGAFIEFENDSRVYGITSAHVVFSDANLKEILEKGQINYKSPNAVTVYQPYRQIFGDAGDAGDAVAALYREGGNGIPGMEIALVEIKQKRWPTDGTFPDDSDHPEFGFGPNKPFEFCSGNVGQLTHSLHSPVVYKYGSESKITKGLYRVNGASVRTQTYTDNILGAELTMHDQLEIEHVGTCPFGEPGDSGGLVVTHEQSDTKLLAVGIFEGKMKGGDVYIVTPMYSVLDELKRLTNNRCWLKKFPEYSFSSNVMNDSHTATVSGLSKKVEKLEQHQNEIKDELRKQSDKTDQILQILVALQNKS